jgi:amino-acid N-acetyltransferase
MIRQRPTLPAVIGLLNAASLPSDDLRDEHLDHFLVAGPEGRPSGVIGLEVYGRAALLRSLAVDESMRSQGVGLALVHRAETYAAERGVDSIYLLTTTAERFFQRLGYARCERSAAPASIRATSEFSSLCPASSAFMLKLLVV